jgi:hypothetical protein
MEFVKRWIASMVVRLMSRNGDAVRLVRTSDKRTVEAWENGRRAV